LEKELRESELVLDATVIASGALAGDRLHASVLSFPAATANTIPLLAALWTAAFNDEFVPPLRLMFATEGPEAVPAT